MERKPQRIDPAYCAEATAYVAQFLASLDQPPNLDRISEHYREMALRDHAQLSQDVKNDPRRERRLERCKCLHCQYRVMMAGAAMTSRPCGLCGREQVYSSTNVGVVCVPCAREHGLCAHCGGDIDCNLERTEFPSSS